MNLAHFTPILSKHPSASISYGIPMNPPASPIWGGQWFQQILVQSHLAPYAQEMATSAIIMWTTNYTRGLFAQAVESVSSDPEYLQLHRSSSCEGVLAD